MARAQRSRPQPRPAPSESIGRWAFLREFLKSPRELGTAFPCSPAVARAMVRGLDTSHWGAAIELGAGTGALTRELADALPRSCRFVAVERSPGLAAEFRRRFPGVHLAEADAADLVTICRELGIRRVDAIFSALPLRLLSADVQDRMLEGAAKVLSPGGVLAQVTYWPRALTAGREMRRRVSAHIGSIESDRLVAGNTPPAWVFRCVKPGGVN